MRFLGVVLVIAMALRAMAQGGPPLITDDPGTPGNKHWEINVAFTETKFSYGTVYEAPHLDLNYGYGDNVQLKLEGPLTIFNGQNGIIPDNYATLGYTNWGVKWRFLEENKKRPAVSTYPQIIFVANNGLARLGVLDPGTDLFLPIEVLKSFGDLLVDAETGVMFRQFTGTQFSSGVCAEYDLTKRFALLGEIHDITSTSIVQDQLVYNLGFKADFTEHESLLFSAGRGIGPAGIDEPAFLTYIALQFRV